MSKQDKGIMCACGCGERKTSRKKKFVPGHTTPPKPPRWALRLWGKA
jgi:hypothetical protein